MKSPKIILSISLLSLALASCSSDEPQKPASAGHHRLCISATHPHQASRASDSGFDATDRIGVYVVDAAQALQPGGNMVNNGCFEYDGASWTPIRDYFWDAGTYNVYAYYPYQGLIESTDEYAFQLPTDQSTPEGFASADLLWAAALGVTAGADPVNLTFSHSLSRVTVNLEKSADYEGALPTDCEVYIHGTYTTANVDLTNGNATVDSRRSIGTIKAQRLSPTAFTAIVVPQRIASRRPLVEVVTGSVSYLMEGTMSFKPGYSHSITVTLSKSPEQVQIEIGGTIAPWQ